MNMILPVGIPIFPPALLSFQSTLEDFIIWAASFSGDWMATMAQKILEFKPADASLAGMIMTYLTAPVAMVIMIISCLTSFLNRWKNGNELTIDDIAKPMFFLIVADIVLTNSGTVVGSLMSLSNLLGDLFNDHLAEFEETIKSGLAEEAEESAADLEESLGVKALSIVGLLFTALTSVIGLVLSFVAGAMLYVVLLSAKVELMLRFIFAPIGLASIADESKKDDVFRYFKKLIASAFYLIGIQIALRYVMIIGISFALGDLDTSTLENSFATAFVKLEAMILQAALPFSAIGMVSVAKNVINESFGS